MGTAARRLCRLLRGVAGRARRARARRMFGGHGLYVDDLFVAIVAGEQALPEGRCPDAAPIRGRRLPALRLRQGGPGGRAELLVGPGGGDRVAGADAALGAAGAGRGAARAGSETATKIPSRVRQAPTSPSVGTIQVPRRRIVFATGRLLARRASVVGLSAGTQLQSMMPCSVSTSVSGRSCARGAKRVLGDLADRPGHADRRDLRMRGQPAVEVAAAVAEPVARAREADAGHEHDVGHDCRRRCRAPACRIRRRHSAPGRPRRGSASRAARVAHRERQRQLCQAGRLQRGDCVKFTANRPVDAQQSRARARAAGAPGAPPARPARAEPSGRRRTARDRPASGV